MANVVTPYKISDFLTSLPDMFTGSYVSKDTELNKFKNEMFNLSRIPSPKDDKANLRNDFNNIFEDIRIAKEKLEEELTNG